MNHRMDLLKAWKSRLLSAIPIAVVVAVVVVLSGCTLMEVAYLNQVELTEFQVEGDRLYLANEINSRSLEQFREVMAAHPDVRTLVLTVVPGSVDDEINLQLGLEVRKRGLNTYLPAGGLIASGGVDLFLAGVERTIEEGAYVGVHSWAAGLGRTGDDVPRDHPDHQPYLSYYRDIDTPADFYWFTLKAAPAGQMHWMDAEEIEQYDVTTRAVLPSGEFRGPFSGLMDDIQLEAEGSDDAPRPVTLGSD